MKKFIDRYSFFASVSTTLIVIMWIWPPEFSLWYVRPAAISTEVISASKTSPETVVLVLEELGQMDTPPSSTVSYNETIRQAENITRRRSRTHAAYLLSPELVQPVRPGGGRSALRLYVHA